VTPCSQIHNYQRLWESCCLRHQGRMVSWVSPRPNALPYICSIFSRSTYSSALKPCCLVTVIQNSRRHIAGHCDVHSHRHCARSTSGWRLPLLRLKLLSRTGQTEPRLAFRKSWLLAVSRGIPQSPSQANAAIVRQITVRGPSHILYNSLLASLHGPSCKQL
jgi:hypothetical protein